MTTFLRIAQIIELSYVDSFDEAYIEHHNTRTKSLELIMSNRSRNLDLFILCNSRFARYLFTYYDVRFQEVTL